MYRNRLFFKNIITFIFLFIIFYSCGYDKSKTLLESYKPLQKVVPTHLNLLGHWLGEGKKEQLLNEIITEFEFANQDILVNMKYPEQIYFDRRKENIETVFNSKIALSDKPEWDIIRLNNEYEKVADSLKDHDWAKKYLVDFSQIPEFRKSTRPELLNDTIKARYGGIIPGPFIDGYNWVLWCNTEVAKKVGIDVKQFDMTFDDFSNYLKAVYDYNKSHNDSIMGIYEAWNWETTKTLAQELFFSEIGNYNEILNFKYSEKKINTWDKVLHDLEKLSVYKPLPNWKQWWGLFFKKN